MNLPSRIEKTEEVITVIADITTDYIVKLSILEFPFLGLPIVKQTYSYIIQKIVGRIKSEGELFITFAMIDSDADQRRQVYTEAIEKLKEVLDVPTTEEAKNEALEETKKRLRDLIRFPVK